jgi:hypothetical protein
MESPNSKIGKLKPLMLFIRHEKLARMGASDTLTDDDLRQLKYDLQNCYDSFNLIIQ